MGTSPATGNQITVTQVRSTIGTKPKTAWHAAGPRPAQDR